MYVAAVVRYLTVQPMPKHTEARIQQLCAQALTVETKADADRIIAELRAALAEHITLAKNSLGQQTRVVAVLDDLAAKDFP
jgi:hypothetical protein